jgi:hypothetical protein
MSVGLTPDADIASGVMPVGARQDAVICTLDSPGEGDFPCPSRNHFNVDPKFCIGTVYRVI